MNETQDTEMSELLITELERLIASVRPSTQNNFIRLINEKGDLNYSRESVGKWLKGTVPKEEVILACVGVFGKDECARLMSAHRALTERPRSGRVSNKSVLQGRIPKESFVGVIIPSSSNPFFSEIGFAFERSLRQFGLQASISSSDGQPRLEMALLDQFRAIEVRGLIYIPATSGADVVLSLIAKGDFPFVVFDRPIKASVCDFVGYDSRVGTQNAVDFLYAHDHVDIGYLKGLSTTQTAPERYHAFLEAMKNLGIVVNEDWIFEGDYAPEAGFDCADALVALNRQKKPLPTAMMAANDLMAIGLSKRLQERGWTLPQDLSIIGYDDIPESARAYPGLTTIAQPVDEIVRVASGYLAKRISERERNPSHRAPAQFAQFEPTLEVRESVAAPRSTATVRPRT